MIIYSANLWLGCDFENVVNIIGGWLSYQFKEKIETLKLNENKSYFSSEIGKLESVRFLDEWPHIQSIIYTHRDDEIKGRQWKTEISLQQSSIDEDIEVSLILTTSEISSPSAR